jgi:hypothetical protein
VADAKLIRKDGITITFISFSTESGWPEDGTIREVEPLTSLGVTGTRLRIPRSDFPIIVATAIAGASTWQAAVNLKWSLYNFKGRLAKLVHTGGGVTKEIDNMLVREVVCRAVPSNVVSSTSYANHIIAEIALQATAEPKVR